MSKTRVRFLMIGLGPDRHSETPSLSLSGKTNSKVETSLYGRTSSWLGIQGVGRIPQDGHLWHTALGGEVESDGLVGLLDLKLWRHMPGGACLKS